MIDKMTDFINANEIRMKQILSLMFSISLAYITYSTMFKTESNLLKYQIMITVFLNSSFFLYKLKNLDKKEFLYDIFFQIATPISIIICLFVLEDKKVEESSIEEIFIKISYLILIPMLFKYLKNRGKESTKYVYFGFVLASVVLIVLLILKTNPTISVIISVILIECIRFYGINK